MARPPPRCRWGTRCAPLRTPPGTPPRRACPPGPGAGRRGGCCRWPSRTIAPSYSAGYAAGRERVAGARRRSRAGRTPDSNPDRCASAGNAAAWVNGSIMTTWSAPACCISGTARRTFCTIASAGSAARSDGVVVDDLDARLLERRHDGRLGRRPGTAVSRQDRHGGILGEVAAVDRGLRPCLRQDLGGRARLTRFVPDASWVLSPTGSRAKNIVSPSAVMHGIVSVLKPPPGFSTMNGWMSSVICEHGSSYARRVGGVPRDELVLDHATIDAALGVPLVEVPRVSPGVDLVGVLRHAGDDARRHEPAQVGGHHRRP